MLDLHPFTLLISLLIITILKKTIDIVGKKTLEDYVWYIYCKLAPIWGHSKLSEISSKSHEARQINLQRKSISAQDQYAKWTKLNRQFDKLTGEIETLNNQLSNEKSTVVKYLSTIISLTTVAPIYFARVWYRKSVLFYIPPGFFPYPIERIFALPFVTLGGVGLTVWMFSVGTVISSLVFLVKFPFETPVQKPEKKEVEKKEKVTEIK